MKSVPDSGPIWSAWANGKALVGPNKPHSRITVQPGWWLNTTDHAGARPPAKLPIRYFQRADNSQQEIEIPGVRSIDVDYDVDQDVATLSVQLVNNRFDPDYGSSEWQNSNGDFGRPGYLTSDRGSVSNRWGYVPNEWSGLLVRNALIRSWEGYGGQDKTLEQAIADGNLVLTGIWLVDDVPIKTGQGFELQARNTGKLLVDQYLYPPLIPAGDYPMSRARFFYSSTTLTTAQVIYGTNGLPNSKYRILRIERSLAGGYWLVGTDGGVFTYGPAHFQGSIDSIGLTITPGTYPSEGVTGISRSHTGDGYWLVTDTGAVYSFGDAAYHGGAGLSDPPAHPVIAIETAGTRDGYWLIGDDGGVFSFGDVDFYGSLPPLVAGAKIVDGASTPDGLGYWLVDKFGHVYSYGNANYFGGITGALGAPIVAIASSPTGNGYVMTGKDGGVFAFGDARFYGSVPGLSPPIVLNDPVCDIVVTASGNGYWLAAEDGGVFAFGDAVFYGSLPQPDTITTDTTTDGNYLDILDIMKDIFLYAGFNLYDGGATDGVYGVLESTGIYVPDEGGNVLDATFFDKLPCQDPLTKLKEIVGYVMYVGDEGEIHFHSPNFWESGNFLPDHSHTATVPVIDERVQLTSYQVNTPDKDLRSEIIISSEDPDLGIAGTVTTSFTPSTARELRGLVRPAMWINEAFVDSATQQTMAELIALHIYFKSRLGSVACMGNPMIQIDDQLQILERETFETNTHYVRRIHRTHDRKAGTYCVDDQTEILTSHGWKTGKEVEIGDLALAFDPSTKTSSWQAIESVFKKYVSDHAMIRMAGGGHSSLTTPDHRWLVTQRGSDHERFTWRTTEKLLGVDDIPVAAPCASLPDVPVFTDSFVEAVGWYWTEGGDCRSRNRSISQSHVVHPEYTDRIRSCLAKEFGEPGPLIGGIHQLPLETLEAIFLLAQAGETRAEIARRLGIMWYTVDKWLRRGLPSRVGRYWREAVPNGRDTVFHLSAEAFRSLDACATAKVLQMDFLTRLTPSQLDLLIETSLCADGCVNDKTTLGQKGPGSRDRAEAFQTACVLAGHGSSLRQRGDGAWVVTLKRRRFVNPVHAARVAARAGSGKGMTIESVPYSGMIWCPQLRHHNWLARRDGYVYFTGNSMQLTTNVLSPPGSWAVVKPTGTPEGSIVVRRP